MEAQRPTREEFRHWLKGLETFNAEIGTEEGPDGATWATIHLPGASYHITAKWPETDGGRGYLGAIADCPNGKGNDLHDGPLTTETWTQILTEIVAYEAGLKAKEKENDR